MAKHNAENNTVDILTTFVFIVETMSYNNTFVPLLLIGQSI